ncbi:right-handed parallel beta-helix repeat-containing protein [Streptomyces sp. AcE210]|uniref:right-handed parallel beta-helix repeat-containing protein n=1 Tax=Streptomyces sp. AcE210 TaxID=2292703 RepID=UPI000E304CAE|nr:right-handed parallel beta-helix repeat-containing protein [Streptomyces sp. AcE210]RFC78030.1 right-handed parallel beta-helix repeat-containing protein [Streptomyces sp. AcE210]
MTNRHPNRPAGRFQRPRAVLLAAAAALLAAGGLPPAAAATPGRLPAVVHAATNGGGEGCSTTRPCSVQGAQSRVRELLRSGPARDIRVELAGGTYRLSEPLTFGPQDSGQGQHRVTWTAAPGAHPVLSGALRVTDWTLHDKDKNIWQAPLPEGLDTRQVYVDGQRAPIAQTTPAELKLAFAAATGGYTTTPATWAQDLRTQIGAEALKGVEFVYTGGNGPWTQSRCRVDSADATTLLMQQPCWGNVTKRPVFTQASGSLPSMRAGTAPTRIENAYPFLHPGQWYIDRERHVLNYVPAPGQDMTSLDVEVPRLSTLVRGTGTLDEPVRNLTFTGLSFSYATWLDPSSPAGFADVQDNLRLTGDDPQHPQGTCTFGTPPGTCPFGALTREPGNVQFTAARDVTFRGNHFTHLGAAGLVLEYGSRDNLVEGNTFADISGNGVILGDTTDPHPSDAGADDREISTGNALANNLIHHVGIDYPSAASITLFFTQHTLVTHNELRDLPYTGISAGVIQGHVDNAAHPENSTNINSDNTISHNLIHRYMQVLKDGGAVYVEGHQGRTITASDGTVDRAASIAHGLTVEGNVAYDQGNVNFTWYDDAGAQWLNWTGNLEWGAKQAQGGCQTTGHLDYTGNVQSGLIGEFHCSPPEPVDTHIADNRTIPSSPEAADLPAETVAQAGLTARHQRLSTALPPGIGFAHEAASGTGVLIAGNGYDDDVQVSFDGTPAAGITLLSDGILNAVPPAGVHPKQVTVTTRGGSVTAEVVTG